MPNFLFAYHGGSAPSSPEEGAKVMALWNAWFEKMGSAVVNGGNPVGISKTVSSSGVADDGGSNPISGFSVISAATMEDALIHAKGCPILDDDGSVEVAQAMEM